MLCNKYFVLNLISWIAGFYELWTLLHDFLMSQIVLSLLLVRWIISSLLFGSLSLCFMHLMNFVIWVFNVDCSTMLAIRWIISFVGFMHYQLFLPITNEMTNLALRMCLIWSSQLRIWHYELFHCLVRPREWWIVPEFIVPSSSIINSVLRIVLMRYSISWAVHLINTWIENEEYKSLKPIWKYIQGARYVS